MFSHFQTFLPAFWGTFPWPPPVLRLAPRGGSPAGGVAASAALHAAREAPGAALLARWSDEAAGVNDPIGVSENG